MRSFIENIFINYGKGKEMRDYICKKLCLMNAKRKKGIVRLSSAGCSKINNTKVYEMIWEIEEITKASGLSKIKLTGFSQTQESLPEWIDTKSIEWIEGN